MARKDTLQDAFWGNNRMTAGSWFFPCTVRKYYTFCTFYLHSRLPSLHMEEFDSARLSECHVCTRDLFTPIFDLYGCPGLRIQFTCYLQSHAFANHIHDCLHWRRVSANLDDSSIECRWRTWQMRWSHAGCLYQEPKGSTSHLWNKSGCDLRNFLCLLKSESGS